MRRGRRPKPDALKIAQGNPGKRPIATSPAPSTADQAHRIEPPPELKHRGALNVWARLQWRLASLNFIQATDADALARYCEYLALWYDLAQKINVNRLVVKTKSAQVEMDRLDRKFQAMLLLDKRLESLEDRFGLNPQARHQLLRDKFNAGRAPGAGQLPGMDQKPAQENPAAEKSAPPASSGSSSIGALSRVPRPPHLNN